MMGHGANEDRAKVVGFWRAAEIFNPQSVPDANVQRNVAEFAGAGPLPWEPGHRLSDIELKTDQVWRHTVYGGIFDVQPVRDLLQDKFGADAESFDARPPGQSALFVLTVTGEGRPLLGSPEFASCGWAVGRLLNPGPQDADWLTGFEDASDACYQAFIATAAADDDDVDAAKLKAQGYDVGHPLNGEDLLGLVAMVSRRFAVADALSPANVRVMSTKVAKSKEFVTDGGELLNSFFVADLARCTEAIEQGDCGAALTAYLRGPGSDDGRLDVLKRPEVVDEGVAPQHTPAGRWPACSGQSLALSQQFAANTIMRELTSEPGLFAVNGPPGDRQDDHAARADRGDRGRARVSASRT